MTAAGWAHAPFWEKDLGAEGELPSRLAALRDGIAPAPGASPEVRAGQLLASAVFHGALLDRKWWQRWLEGALRLTLLMEDLAWVDMEPLDLSADGPDSQPRRWFADPITRVLLAHWHHDAVRSAKLNADDCLQAFFGTADVDWSDLLLRHARLHWQLRIPPLLVTHALGVHRVVPVPGNDWRRVIGLNFTPADGPYRFCSTHKSSARAIDAQISPLRAILDRVKNSPTGKRATADKIARQYGARTCDSCLAALAGWCVFALTLDRGRLPKGFAPSTVKGYLTYLATEVFDPGDDPQSWTDDQLGERYDTRLSEIEDGNRRNKTLNAIASFHAYLRSRRPELAPLPQHLEDHRAEGRASANLLSPGEFQNALALCRTTEQKLCLILPFRAGLRLRETLGLLVTDFHIHGGGCDLVIARNQLRKLKTLTSRRILPLDLLLEPDELKLLLGWVKKRRVLAQASYARGLLVGPLNAAEPLSEKHVLKELDDILHRATGAALTAHHLRHSFASYVLATMLLPEGTSELAVPAPLRSAISVERKSRLTNRLLGPEKLGQHALHAVSALLGHIVSATTLRWYSHLLDLSLQHYVSRTAVQAAIPLPQVLGLTGQRSAKRPALQSCRPRESTRRYQRPIPSPIPLDGTNPKLWQVSTTRGRRTKRIERVLSGPLALEERPKHRSAKQLQVEASGTDWREIAAAIHGYSDHSKSEQWRSSADALLTLRLKTERPRHEIEALAVSRSGKWQSLVDQHWRPQVKLTALERRALFYAVTHWDGSRSGVRFQSRPLAQAWRDLLRRYGLLDDQVRLTISGRFPQRSSTELHALLATSNDLPGTAARRGWRGTIMVSFQSEARQFKSAIHFFILILAIHEGYAG